MIIDMISSVVQCVVLVVLPLASFTYHISLSLFRLNTYEITKPSESAFISNTVILSTILFFFCRCQSSQEWSLQIAELLLLALQMFMVYVDVARNLIGVKFSEIDLSSKVFIVTGCNTGIGFETVLALVKMDATVVMGCRSQASAEEARLRILKLTNCAPSKVLVLKLDLCRVDSVRQFVKEFRGLHLPLHALINNAGLMQDKRTITADGCETVFSANHLGPFLLSNLLLPDLEKTSGRVVTLTSSLHRLVDQLDFDDIMCEQAYELFNNYAKSKLANLLFTKELQRRLLEQGSPVKCFAVHPGCVRTTVTRHMSPTMQFLNTLFAPIVSSLQKTPEQGSYTSVYAATSPDLDAAEGGGLYFHCQPINASRAASDPIAARSLWTLSEKLTGIHR